jgi:hypothetical protein
VLADDTGCLPLLTAADVPGSGIGDDALALLLACTAGSSVPVVGEWTPDGLLPLALHLDGHVVDLSLPIEAVR